MILKQRLLPSNLSFTTFPEKGEKGAVIAALREAKKELEKKKRGFQFGKPTPIPYSTSLEALNMFSPINPNNIGLHTRKYKKKLGLFQRYEREVISMIASLNGASLKEIDGYITSGGTEGNIVSLWIARNHLRKGSSSKEIAVLGTALTHYSIGKAVDLLDIKNFFKVPLNRDYQMDAEGLKEKIQVLFKRGFNNFTIVATTGSTQAGSVDSIESLDKVIQESEKKLGIRCFLLVDAAFGGLVLPFISEEKFGFSYSRVQSLVIDPHKTGLVPYPAGIFLCRKGLLEIIEREVKYLSFKDATLIGSRPGVAAAVCWAVFSSLGKEGFRKIIEDCSEVKKYFLEKISALCCPQDILGDPRMNVLAVSFPRRFSKKLEKKYALSPFHLPQKGKRIFYTFYFMPHIEKLQINKFLEDLKNDR